LMSLKKSGIQKILVLLPKIIQFGITVGME
jgi:hypothetical protein